MNNEEKNTALVPANFQEQMQIAKTLEESGLFKHLTSPAQVFAVIQAGAEMGMKPFESINSVHLIQGKPTISAGAMASRVKAHPNYDYRVKELNDTDCQIEFFQKGESLGIIKYTAKQAKAEGVKNMGKIPQDMLFARAISKGTRRFCPDALGSQGTTYVHGEIENTTLDVQHEEVEEPAEVNPNQKIGDLIELLNGIDESSVEAYVKAHPDTKVSVKVYRDTIEKLCACDFTVQRAEGAIKFFEPVKEWYWAQFEQDIEDHNKATAAGAKDTFN